MPSRKGKSAQLPAVRFPIIKLPPELQHLIFAESDIGDICSLRLTCKALAEIGIGYLMRQVELLFTRGSFDRLNSVDPNHACHVRSLVYCVSALSEFRDMDQYLRRLADRLEYDLGAEHMRGWPAGASSRELRFYQRQCARAINPKTVYTPRQLQSGWEAYKTLCDEQTLLRTENYGEKELTDRISHMKCLNQVTLNCWRFPIKESKHFAHAYKGILMLPYDNEGRADSGGLPPLLSIARAINKIGRKIEAFTAHRISWKLLKADGETRKLLECFFGTVKSFTTTFEVGLGQDEGMPPSNFYVSSDQDQADLEKHVCQGRHLWLLRSMPDLRAIDLRLMNFGQGQLDMAQVFGGIRWCHLQTVKLREVKGTDRNLLDFVQQHAAKLETLTLDYFLLTKGLWLYVFREMRAIQGLTGFVSIVGLLNSHEELDQWTIDRVEIGFNELADKIENYILGTDAVTLGDIINHGEVCSCQGGPYHDMHPSLPPQR
ncbi:MAG: hypothetical protein Q9168_006869 [Polycauliona sp. 1 TL-2023]